MPKARSTPRGSCGRDRRDTRALRRVRAALLEGRRASRRPTRVSLAERIQAELAGPVVAGLHSLAASSLGAEHPPDEDAFVCGDDVDAKALGLELAERLTTGRALDAGPLASARALEGLTAVIVNLNKRYKGHAGIQVTGLA